MVDWKNPDYTAIYAERAKRLTNLRANPSILAGLEAYYAEHPADFINDWAMTYDPRLAEIGKATNVPFLLFPKQREFIDFVYERWRSREDWLAEKSRDMGVTWLCVGFAVWMWRFHRGTTIGFGSRKEEYVDKLGDPKSIFWKLRVFIDLLPKELRPKGYESKAHAPFMRIANPDNGSVIVGEAGDNIGRGNRTSIYFKDESAFYERPELIDAALSQTSNCKGDVSTPNGPGNPFYRKRKGGKVKVFTFHWKDDPRKGEDWYEKQCRDLDPVVVAQEIDINYEASVADAFIPGPLVDEAMRNGPVEVEARGPKKWGLDVARFGDDKSSLVKRQTRVVYSKRNWAMTDTMTLASEVAAEARKETPDQIAVDVIGLGAGVYDRLKELLKGTDIQVVAVNSSIRVSDGVNYNLRAKMWEKARDWFQDGPVSILNDPDLKSQLTALKYEYRNGYRLIESKDDAKKRGIKSPDDADAFVLTFAEDVIAPNKTLSFRREFAA